MISSMTGFGTSQLEAEGISFLLEIRSLNNRFLKMAIKLPEAVAFTSQVVEKIIRQEVARGAITYTLHMRYVGEVGALEINQAAMEKYVASMEQVRTMRGDNGMMRIDLAEVLQLPGVCQPREYSKEETAFFLETIKKLTNESLGQLRQMRLEEGQSLLADLQRQEQVIRDNLEAISELVDTVVDNYRIRLKQRVDQMLAEVNLQLDEELLLKETALFAERCDINEEISRLKSHLEQFCQGCRINEQAGRRLDFLTQEMLREANTIASKSNDAKISQHVVEIKVAIDRLREQVQNVE
jgi:uncharacterized protein (TIGR00255 family)